ncbi:MAG TPA: DUF4199 domain-containing protein [Longimicrobiales bacterium]|nr:DUF4199 domain-containing protein [Longimicrobiales bacterium]
MKKTVWTFGLIAGAILSAMMLATMPFMDRIGFDTGEVIGYTTLVAALLLIFFGVRSYRDNQAGRSISFGRAFLVGLLINLVASACYVATWEFIYFRMAPDFGDKYAAHTLEKERAKGATEEQLARKTAEMQRFQELYRNPLFNVAVTFLEPFPAGLVVSLLSAAVLRRRRDPASILSEGPAAGISAFL